MAPNGPTLRVATLGLSLSLTIAGCGSGAPARSSSAAPRDAKVAISNYAFSPATVTVPVGTKLTFTNHDQTAHTATSTEPGFDTGTVKAGHSATVELSKPGTYTYYCQFHAFMRATIVVK